MRGESSPEAKARTAGRGSLLLSVGPLCAYVAVTAITLVLALNGRSQLIVIAPLVSTIVFAFGILTSDPDVVFLGWLDQGSNLVLFESEATGASVLLVMVSVTAILLLGDLVYATMSSKPYGVAQAMKQLRQQAPRLLLVGGAACILALVAVSLVPVVTIASDPVLALTVMAVAALVAVAVLGSTDR
jgi:hypothetical protein